MKSRRLLYALPVVFALIYFLLSFELPFWGDSIASVSKAAVRIYQDGLHRPWNYPDADPGHGTLYPWLIAFCWKIFGFSLWVPHALAALCFFLLLRLFLFFLSSYPEKWQLIGLLLIAASPLSVSQAMEISLQLPLTLAFFSAVYGLQKKKYFLWTVSMCALVLLHAQGVLLLAALGLYDLWRSWPLQGSWWKRSTLYLVPAAVFGTWCYFHYNEFGWALVTPNYPRAVPGIGSAVYNLAISAWRLLDLGYFILAFPVLFMLAKAFAQKRLSDTQRLFIPVGMILCIGIPFLFAYPPNHRYIFPVYLLLVPLFIDLVRNKGERARSIWLGVSFILLLSGSFWYYPGKCLGDQNLVFLGYHKLEKQMMADLPYVARLHSYAPLNNPSRYTWMEEWRFASYHDLYDRHIPDLDWVVESNVNCEFTEEDRALLREHFVARSYETYGVYINLWMNKRLQSPLYGIEFNGPHQPGAVERFIQKLKSDLR